MAKHLIQTEKKTPRSNIPREIHIPERKNKRTAPKQKTGFFSGDGFQSAMLNKTLDRRFSAVDLILAGLALLWLCVARILPTQGLVRVLSFLVPFLLAGYTYLYEAFQEAFMGIVLGRELIITLAALMAFCGGDWFGGAAIMVFLKVCDLALSYVESVQSEKIAALYSLRPEKASLVNANGIVFADAEQLAAGNEIEVGAGETIPADGVVLEGTSVLDASPLLGESRSFPVAAGSAVVSGCRNVNAPLRIRVEKAQSDSVCSILIRAAENAWMHKSERERLLQRILSYLSPALVILALLYAVGVSLATGDWRTHLVRAALLLTVSQMYSAVQSVKLSYDCAAAASSAMGVISKGHDVFEALSRAETMVFDKTGTVTEGEYRIKEVFPRGVTEGQLLFIAGAAELHSRHPIAEAIVAASGAYTSELKVDEIAEIPGRGVSAFIDGRSVYVGNAAMMEDHAIAFDAPKIPGTAIHVAVDGRYIGHIVLEDALRDCAFDVIEELRVEGVKTSVLLTGDVHSSARRIASSLNFDLVKAELTPEEKCSSVEYLMSNRNVNTTLAFVGDGVCDSDALRLSTVGITLGSMDRPEALSAADAAILGKELRTLPKLYRLAKRSARSAMENISVCGAVKLLALIFGAAGVFSLAFSAFLQTLAVLLEAFNALSVLNFDEERRFMIKKKGK